MTFIIAIQLNDSAIIAADNKKIVLKETKESQFNIEMASKIYPWDNGIITGTGEGYVVSRSIELFKKLAHSDLNKLPQCLEISRQMRELEIGTNYFQVENTKLLCSSYSKHGAQLYKIERFDPLQPYKLIVLNHWIYQFGSSTPTSMQFQQTYNIFIEISKIIALLAMKRIG